MADAMRIAFADRCDLDGRLRLRAGAGEGAAAPRPTSAMRSARSCPTRASLPTRLAGDPRPFDMAGIKPATRLAVAEPVDRPGETTTHFAVVDKWGNMVSYTNTIESSHGIGVFAGYTQPDGSFRNFGFLLNNELTDFNTTPTTNPYTGSPGYNDVQPNKRPRSSMTPTMIFTPDGKPIAAFGSPGGATIINSVFNVTLNLIDHGMTRAGGDRRAARVGHRRPAPRLGRARLPGGRRSTAAGAGLLGRARAEIGSVQAVIVDRRPASSTAAPTRAAKAR